MDIQLDARPPQSERSLLIRTAIQALVAWVVIALITSVGVHWLSGLASVSSPLGEIAEEQLRWIFPVFTYIWAMFYMIERAMQFGAGLPMDLHAQHRGRSLFG